MTTRHVVADDVLGMISRKTWELQRRVMEGSLDVDRVLGLLQQTIEGTAIPTEEDPNLGRTYVVESFWAYDNSHHEFATITLEPYELVPPTFDDILKPDIAPEKKQVLVSVLERIFAAQIPTHGSRKLFRLHRVVHQGVMGLVPQKGGPGSMMREVADLHFTLRPICDFNDRGEPIPCTIRKWV